MKTPPIQIYIAAGFIILCAAALVTFAIALFLASLRVPHNPVYATRIQTRGFIFMVLLILGSAVALIHGVRRLLTQGVRKPLFVTLGIPLALGTVGETIDLFGTASHTSDLIGAGILVLFAIPIALLALPASSSWCASRT